MFSLSLSFVALQGDSLSRKKNLSSLYDFILRCNKEISYLTEQEDRIHKIDWSDLIRDPAGLRSDYEVKTPRMKSLNLLKEQLGQKNMTFSFFSKLSSKPPAALCNTLVSN